MLTARVAIRYEADWTEKLSNHRVYGKFLAYTFKQNRYLALVVLSSSNIEETNTIIKNHDSVTDVQIINKSEFKWGSQQSETLIIKSKYRNIPPIELLTYEGFYPIGDPSIENGKIHIDLLLADRDSLIHAVALLEDFGNVSVEYISDTFHYHMIPQKEEFNQLLKKISPEQLELLSRALDQGYFEDTRDSTLQQLSSNINMAESTASRHLREVRKNIMHFFIDYLNEKGESGGSMSSSIP